VSCPAFIPWRSQAALAYRTLGETEVARRLVAEELELARAFGAPRSLGVAQRAAGLLSGGESGEELLRASLASHERAGAELERARTLTDLGALLRRDNRRAEARELLREALDTAHGLSAGPLVERSEIELRATGARPRRVVLTGVDSLTASERRIADYAGQGLTNREIAQTLYITTRTVEGHLTSVFRKLRVDSRTELAVTLSSPADVIGSPLRQGSPQGA
jgi:DNA-binding CsgD family transcriptional regulator